MEINPVEVLLVALIAGAGREAEESNPCGRGLARDVVEATRWVYRRTDGRVGIAGWATMENKIEGYRGVW